MGKINVVKILLVFSIIECFGFGIFWLFPPKVEYVPAFVEFALGLFLLAFTVWRWKRLGYLK